MTGLEALMWRIGARGARYVPSLTLAVRLDGPVRSGPLLDRLRAVCAAVPRLTQRPSAPSLSFLPPAWVAEPGFAVEHHITVDRSPLEEVLASVVSRGFDAGRPPWSAVLVGDGSAVVFHLHHCYTDGLGGLALLGALVDPGPDGRPEPAAPAAGGPGLLGDLAAEAAHHAALVSRTLPWAGRTLAGAVGRPSSVLDPARALAEALSVHARHALGSASPLLGARGEGAAVQTVTLPLGPVRATAASLSVTVNDVFLAGLLEGLSRWHIKRGAPAASLRLGLPISARTSGTEMMGNHLLGAALRAPLGTLDFAERARLVHEMVLMARDQPWAGLAGELGELLSRVPGSDRLMAGMVSSMDVLASNVTRIPVPLCLLGAGVTGLLPLGPRAGAAINATLLSYRDDACIGLNLDPAAVSDPDVLADCVRAAFEENLAPG